MIVIIVYELLFYKIEVSKATIYPLSYFLIYYFFFKKILHPPPCTLDAVKN